MTDDGYILYLKLLKFPIWQIVILRNSSAMHSKAIET